MFATKKLHFRLLCVLMSVVTPLTPSAAVLAQSPDGIAENANLQYILPYSAAIVSARPRQLLTSEMAQALPIEVVQAAGIKELGLDPLTIESIVFLDDSAARWSTELRDRGGVHRAFRAEHALAETHATYGPRPA